MIVAVLLVLNAGLLYLCRTDDAREAGRIIQSTADAGSGKGTKAESEKGTKTESKDASDKDTKDKKIRVLLKTDGYHNLYHARTVFYAKGGLAVTYGKKTKTVKGKLTISPDDSGFSQGKITVKSKSGGKIRIDSLNRGYGHPSYAGKLDLYTSAEGIVIVNELPLETYLRAVIPSEMPSSYEKEALKAQAVCARSFAYKHLDSYAYEKYKANMDDSTSFQVYGNSKPADSSNQAVKETAGEMIWYKDEIINAYYYSTSCGQTASAAVWGSQVKKTCPYLKSISVSDGEEDYEKELPWYQWSAKISSGLLSDLLSQYAGKSLGKLQSVKVTKRDQGGAAIQLKAVGSQGSVTVKTENKIRRALGGSGYKIKKNDGSYSDSSELLPSAFFEIKKSGNSYVLTGGGLGHGLGMSQNGANEMAKDGKDYKEILETFYSGVKVRCAE